MADEFSSQPPDVTCSNCATIFSGDKPFCPNCGKPTHTATSWPPSPSVALEPAIKPRLLTSEAWLDSTIGFLICVLASFLFGTVLIVAPLLYFGTINKYKYVALGVKYYLITAGCILLGLLAICVAQLFSWSAGWSHP